jgi:hypothetical protein
LIVFSSSQQALQHGKRPAQGCRFVRPAQMVSIIEFFLTFIQYFSSSSSRIISAKDHGSIQIDFVDVDPKTGRAIPNKVSRYAICGALRAMVSFWVIAIFVISKYQHFNYSLWINLVFEHF